MSISASKEWAALLMAEVSLQILGEEAGRNAKKAATFSVAAFGS
jgi:hypothetical protein